MYLVCISSCSSKSCPSLGNFLRSLCRLSRQSGINNSIRPAVTPSRWDPSTQDPPTCYPCTCDIPLSCPVWGISLAVYRFGSGHQRYRTRFRIWWSTATARKCWYKGRTATSDIQSARPSKEAQRPTGLPRLNLPKTLSLRDSPDCSRLLLISSFRGISQLLCLC